MKKKGVSLRYKILFLLTIIPVLTLASYLVLAMRIFESDKIAYVFDSTSNMSATVAAQVKTQLNALLASTKPMFQDYLLNVDAEGKRSFSAFGDKTFRAEPLLDIVAAYRQKADGSFELVSVLEKTQDLLSDLSRQRGADLTADFADVSREGRILRIPFGDDRVLIFEKFADKNETTVFLILTRLSETAEMFRTAMSQKMYLVGRDGRILFGPSTDQAKNLVELVEVSFLRDPEAKVVQGAETSRDAEGKELLVSYSKAGFGDLIVVSTVSKDKALGAVQVLLRRSLIFFVILICVTAIISLVASGTITQALSALFSATQKVSQGDFAIRVDVKSNDEVGVLAENFNIMAAEVSRLLEQTAEKARMESELQTAKTVQETLFPEANSRIGNLSIAGFYEPASECGGDWWHYCKASGDRVLLWIGDATGHGAPAALITSAAKSASTIIERLNIGPGLALSLLNRSICEVSRGRLMMTFFLASYDPKTCVLSYANASHEAPFLIKKSEGPLKKKDLIPLNDVVNPRLGQAKETEYQEGRVQLDPGDLVFFYTDGVPDIRSPSNDAWGEREFVKALLASNKGFPPVEQSVSQFVRTFQTFRQGSTLPDDVTFFLVKNEEVQQQEETGGQA